MLYIKFTNGAVSKLINAANEVAQREALDNGFYMVMGEDGIPEAVDSSTLIRETNKDRAELLRKVSEKYAKRSASNMANSTLASKANH